MDTATYNRIYRELDIRIARLASTLLPTLQDKVLAAQDELTELQDLLLELKGLKLDTPDNT